MSHPRHVAVLGAGIVGVAAALELLRDGHHVTLVDPGPPGGTAAASHGNGAWLSPYSVIPPAGPGLWRRVPGFLRDPLGPLAIRPARLPAAAPWLLRYLLSGWTEARVGRIARALRPLLADAPALHAALAEEAGVPRLVRRDGLLLAYPDRAAFEAEAMAWRVRAAVGLRWTELSGDALHREEPALSPAYAFGVLLEEGGHCLDPGALVAALAARALSRGAAHRRERALSLRIERGRLLAVRTPSGEFPCDAAVVCAGAWSRRLAVSAGDRVPLESERGYHAVVPDPGARPRRPLMPSDGKMAITLTDAGLRVAGQVEIAGLLAAPDWRRAAILRDHLLRVLPGLSAAAPAGPPPGQAPEAPSPARPGAPHVWMGHRPSTPDGLPCIGPARRTPDVVHAFGHGHVGLASAPRTARLVAQLLSGRTPEIPIAPFRPARFSHPLREAPAA